MCIAMKLSNKDACKLSEYNKEIKNIIEIKERKKEERRYVKRKKKRQKEIESLTVHIYQNIKKACIKGDFHVFIRLPQGTRGLTPVWNGLVKEGFHVTTIESWVSFYTLKIEWRKT